MLNFFFLLLAQNYDRVTVKETKSAREMILSPGVRLVKTVTNSNINPEMTFKVAYKYNTTIVTGLEISFADELKGVGPYLTYGPTNYFRVLGYVNLKNTNKLSAIFGLSVRANHFKRSDLYIDFLVGNRLLAVGVDFPFTIKY
jgi:hypothetical protein